MQTAGGLLVACGGGWWMWLRQLQMLPSPPSVHLVKFGTLTPVLTAMEAALVWVRGSLGHSPRTINPAVAGLIVSMLARPAQQASLARLVAQWSDSDGRRSPGLWLLRAGEALGDFPLSSELSLRVVKKTIKARADMTSAVGIYADISLPLARWQFVLLLLPCGASSFHHRPTMHGLLARIESGRRQSDSREGAGATAFVFVSSMHPGVPGVQRLESLDCRPAMIGGGAAAMRVRATAQQRLCRA